ncbi:MAG TPA: ABC transporter permease, partial [Longimicrobiales bacterium]|nr:ABC transporter permease [Longimicrobiales bacterium]
MLNWLSFRALFMRRRLEREMREEMSAHIASATARNIARGMLPAAAAKAAQREFGNIDYLQEQARDARGARWIDALRGDVRFAFRHFARTPLATFTMIVVLAGGIGANTVLFTVFHSILTLPGPGIPRDESIVRVRGTEVSLQYGHLDARGMAYTEVAEYAQLTQYFDGIAASISNDGLLTTADRQRPALPAAIVYASDNYFALLGVRLRHGRVWSNTPLTADPTTVLTGVISHTVWEAVFDTAAAVIGRTLRINDMTVTVVGVAPRSFRGTGTTNNSHHVWLPFAAYPLVEKSDLHVFASPDSAYFTVVARLRDGVTRAQTLPTVKAIAQRADAQRAPFVRIDGETVAAMPRIASTDVVPLRVLNHSPDDEQHMKLALAGLGSVTLLILLVTCTNVSSLLVGLAVARRREIAVRLSLGAGRARVIRQLITESTLLAIAAALLAAFVTWVILRILVLPVPTDMISDYVVFDWRAIGFTVAVAFVTVMIFGLSPALHATRVALADVLKDAGAAVSGARAWPQRILVVAQITLTQPLLVAAGAIILLSIAEVRGLMTSDVDDRIVIMEFDDDSRTGSREDFRADMARVAERLAA